MLKLDRLDRGVVILMQQRLQPLDPKHGGHRWPTEPAFDPMPLPLLTPPAGLT
jgi:hypothetical protein